MRTSLTALVVLGAAILGAVSEPAPAQEEGFFERDRLTGDWDGMRKAVARCGH